MQTEVTHYSVEHVAASCFWHLAGNIGIDEAVEQLKKTKYKALFDEWFLIPGLSPLQRHPMPSMEAKKFDQDVKDYVRKHIKRPYDLIGPISKEEILKGRSHFSDISFVRRNSKVIKVTGNEGIPKIGSLCLRNQLPTVVITDQPVTDEVIEVQDTTMALGSHHPMILCVEYCKQHESGAYVVTGDLYFRNGLYDDTIEEIHLWRRLVVNGYPGAGVGVKLKGELRNILFHWVEPEELKAA